MVAQIGQNLRGKLCLQWKERRPLGTKIHNGQHIFEAIDTPALVSQSSSSSDFSDNEVFNSNDSEYDGMDRPNRPRLGPSVRPIPERKHPPPPSVSISPRTAPSDSDIPNLIQTR